jgi:outer membrane protein OmpA-like peptidoglycan-associated protein
MEHNNWNIYAWKNNCYGLQFEPMVIKEIMMNKNLNNPFKLNFALGTKFAYLKRYMTIKNQRDKMKKLIIFLLLLIASAFIYIGLVKKPVGNTSNISDLDMISQTINTASSVDGSYIPLSNGIPVITSSANAINTENILAANASEVATNTSQVLANSASKDNNTAINITNQTNEVIKPIELPSATEAKEAIINTGKVVLNLDFPAGKSSLDPKGVELVAQIANLLKDNKDIKISVDGYTDSSGSAAMNKNVSGQRANAVAELLAKNGFAKSNMKSAGHGSEKPLVDNSTAQNRAKNRRVELVLIKN